MFELALRAPADSGPYPEQGRVRPGWLDDTAETLAAPFARRLRVRSVLAADIVSRVGREQPACAGLSLAGIGEAAAALRKLARRHGLDEPLAARAFALVRAAAERTLGMQHRDCQLLGGWILLNGMVAEMETGEGKTLTATLPACTVALAGVPVHVITVNDYLTGRDAEAMAPVYHALGLTVGTVISGQGPDDRRAAYACDVTYCTDKELAFDYLRDRLAAGQNGNRAQRHIERLAQQGSARRLTMRGLFYAIVDEADSVLVDGARTPLVIANRGEQSAQRATLEAALHVARSFAHGVHFSLNPRERRVELLPAGQAKLATSGENFQAAVRGPRRGEALVAQALAALHVYERDKHYLVRDDRVQIIDESTGRILPGRSWEQGLHQMIEAKEGCTITDEQSAIARITYQRFFRRYLRLAGMTGTAREVSGELWSVYRLPVVRVPTSRPLARRDLGTHVVANAREKWRVIAERTRALHAEGRPVLIGTRSVEASEQLSAVLNAAGLAHDLLNARQDGHEAQIIARAGERGRITVATNMAGRGTDIRLGAGVADVGGLHVIATELHEASRIDRQLHGRCGRQGDPGSFETLVALDDHLVRSFMGTAGRICVRILTRTGARRLNRIPLRWAQARAERYYASVRRELRETDDRLQDALAFAGRRE